MSYATEQQFARGTSDEITNKLNKQSYIQHNGRVCLLINVVKHVSEKMTIISTETASTAVAVLNAERHWFNRQDIQLAQRRKDTATTRSLGNARAINKTPDKHDRFRIHCWLLHMTDAKSSTFRSRLKRSEQSSPVCQSS